MKPFDEQALSNFIKEARKLVLVSMGNALGCDDAVGVEIGEGLLRDKKLKIDIFVAYQSPEAYLMKILERDYSHVIFIDAIDANKRPGEVFYVSHEEIINEKISTHRFPLKMLLEVLLQHNKKILFIGIQIKKRGVGIGLSREVEEAKRKLLLILKNYLEK